MTETRPDTPSFPVPDTAEQRLAQTFATGDAWTLREAYDRYGTQVYRIALACLRNASDAEEITQTVFVDAWRGRSTFDAAKGSLGGWLMAIAKRASTAPGWWTATVATWRRPRPGYHTTSTHRARSVSSSRSSWPINSPGCHRASAQYWSWPSTTT